MVISSYTSSGFAKKLMWLASLA